MIVPAAMRDIPGSVSIRLAAWLALAAGLATGAAADQGSENSAAGAASIG